MNKQNKWHSIFEKIKENIEDKEALKWVKDLKIIDIKQDILYLEAPNRYIKMWVEDNYIDFLKELLKSSYNIDTDIKITLKNNNIKKEEHQKNSDSSNDNSGNISTSYHDYYSISLHKDFTFDNFVSGVSNRFAYASCLNAAKGYERLNNPIYIYGDVGLGKTHLLHAVGNLIKVNFPKKHVFCITGELFMKEFVYAMSNKLMDDFNKKYSLIDVLLFDDVQFITKGQATSDEFFFLFSKLYSDDKQIILTSNSEPKDIVNLDERLCSRFQSGLIVEIGVPSADEKIAIIENYLRINKHKLDNEVIRFIADNIKSESTRDLLGVVNTIIVKSQLYNEKINIDYIEKELGNFFIKKDKVFVPQDIIDAVSSYYHIKLIDMQSKSRAVNIVTPRNMAIYLIYKYTASSLKSIGNLFNRDHSTIKNSISNIEAQIEKNDDYTINTLKELKNKLNTTVR